MMEFLPWATVLRALSAVDVVERLRSTNRALHVFVDGGTLTFSLTPAGLTLIEYQGLAIGNAQVLGLPVGAARLWRVEAFATFAAGTTYVGLWDQPLSPALGDPWRRQLNANLSAQNVQFDWTNVGGLAIANPANRFWIGASTTAPLYTAVTLPRWQFNAWYT